MGSRNDGGFRPSQTTREARTDANTPLKRKAIGACMTCGGHGHIDHKNNPCDCVQSVEAMELLREYNRITASTICSFEKNTAGHNELNAIRKKAADYLKTINK